ncbi:MFS superfamily export protein YceL [Klebsiella pneumoniae IS22]|nr:MFS superfamily export protein YceL [Klebsiella pneumoniae IS22]
MSRVSQARNLGKYFLLIDNMLVVLGFFVVFPLISIRFVDQMAGPPSWSVLLSVYANLFSKVWVFSAAQLPTALVPNR